MNVIEVHCMYYERSTKKPTLKCKGWGDGDQVVAQVVELLPRKSKDLSSNPPYHQKKKKDVIALGVSLIWHCAKTMAINHLWLLST
jgi:hypothetical protein